MASTLCLTFLVAFLITGQNVDAPLADAVRAVEDRLRQLDNSYDPVASDLRLLASNLSQSISISPYSLFTVNNSNLLAAMATIFAYLVELVQFNASDSQVEHKRVIKKNIYRT